MQPGNVLLSRQQHSREARSTAPAASRLRQAVTEEPWPLLLSKVLNLSCASDLVRALSASMGGIGSRVIYPVRAATEAKLAKGADDAAAPEAEAARRAPAAAKLRRAADARREKAARLQARLHEIEDRIFEAFSQKARPRPLAAGCTA